MSKFAARHLAANLLHTYTEIADTQDIEGAVALLGEAEVRFPSGGFDRPEDAHPFFERIWSTRTNHRHDVTNLVVRPEEHEWRARAHYVRWMFDDQPAVHTLGRYDLVLTAADNDLTVRQFTVVREWSRA